MEFLQRNQRFVSRMVAADPRTLEVLARAQKVAALDTTIRGCWETGVGKEQFARYIIRTPPAPGRASSASTAAPSRPA